MKLRANSIGLHAERPGHSDNRNPSPFVQETSIVKWVPVAALTAVSSIACAQSTLTIYGRLDPGLIVGSFDGASKVTQVAGAYSGARLGFRGSEDLGAGLRAGFQLEGALNLDSGTGGVSNAYAFNRGSYVTLGDDSWGELALGRMYGSPFWVYLASAVGIGGQNLGTMGASAVLQTSVLTGKSGWGGYYDNSVRYRTPYLSGFKAELQYSPNGGSVNSDVASNEQSGAAKSDGRTMAFNVQYEREALYLGGSYERFTTFKVATGNADQRSWMLAGRYKISMATVGVNVGQTRNATTCYASGTTSTGNTLGCDLNTFAINTQWDIAERSSVDLSVARLSASSGSKNGATSHTLALGYTYFLSKRTWLYAQATRINNNSKANWNFSGTGFLPAGNVTPLGASPYATAVGIFQLF
jgi:predicted porin